MFLNLFYELRDAEVPVGTQEWLTLMEAVEKGLHGSSLKRFYHLARACLIKHEGHFDAFDRVFAKVFHGVEGSLDSITDEVLKWLSEARDFPQLTPEQLAELERLSNDELMKRFLETLAEQDEQHDGGNKWVGTGGRSPYGHGGVHPTGIRVGGPGRSRSAMKVAEERQFEDYRTDVRLDVRQLKVAIRRLRQWTRLGGTTELDLDESIDETCRNAGEIELVFRAPRRNNVRVLLLMDVGGTMSPWFEPVSRLLTALHEERGLKSFEALYFHNCIYDHVYTSARLTKASAIPTTQVLRSHEPFWKLIVVGDAAMHPAELLEPYGGIDPRVTTATPGIDWMHRLHGHFDRSVWLNPEPAKTWDRTHTTRVLRRIFPMFPLSVDGLSEAVRLLVGVGKATNARAA